MNWMMVFAGSSSRLRSRSVLRVIAGALLAGLVAALAGCARPDGMTIIQRPETQLAWPPESFSSSSFSSSSVSSSLRIRLVGAIDQPFGRDETAGSFWRALADWTLGPGETRFAQPHAALLTPEGELFVTDTADRVVYRFEIGSLRGATDARPQIASAVVDSPDAPLRAPVGLARSPAGEVYLADSAAACLYRLDRSDARHPVWRRWAAGVAFSRPTAIGVHPQTGEVYVVDAKEHCVKVLTPPAPSFSSHDGSDVRLARTVGRRGRQPGEFNFPVAIAFAPNGDWLVADALNFRVQRFDARDRHVSSWGLAGDAPQAFVTIKALALDAAGHAYVLDSGADAVKLFDRAGAFMFEIGKPGAAMGEFWLPAGLSLLPGGLIAVADTFNRRVQLFQIGSEDGVGRDGQDGPDAGAQAIGPNN